MPQTMRKTIAIETAKAMHESTSMRTLTSDCSWPDPFGLCPMACSMLVSMPRRSIRVPRIVRRQQRPGFQMPYEECDPDAADADGGHDVGPVDHQASLAEGRLHNPEYIHQPDRDHPQRHQPQPLRVLLDEAHQQQEEGHAEV